MIKIHVPVEEYGFVEADAETADEARTLYSEVKEMFKHGEGLGHKEWITALDSYLNDGIISADNYADMSKAQQYVIQELKKSFKRVNK